MASASPFPPLELTREDRHELEALAKRLVDEVLIQYERHVERPHLDPARWKFLKQREDIRVYKARHGHLREPAASRAESTPAASAGLPPSTSSAEPQASEPELLATGSIVGDLYDVLYGGVSPTAPLMRLKTAYVRDRVLAAAVLAPLQVPTAQEPFHSLAVKWVVKGQARGLGAIARNRDLVYLEATGVTHLPTNDELVGYHLLHSVSFPTTPPLPRTPRGRVSLCAIYRPRSSTLRHPGREDDPDHETRSVVEVFVRGRVALEGTLGPMYRAIVVQSAAQVMLSVWRNLHCAQMKKLAYALRRWSRGDDDDNDDDDDSILPKTDRMRLLSASKRASSKTVSDQHVRHECGICGRRGLPSGLSLAHCELCRVITCGGCRVKKTLAMIVDQATQRERSKDTAPDRGLRTRRMRFCVLCMSMTYRISALDVAVDEILCGDGTHGYN